MEDFYRRARRAHGVLLDGTTTARPAGGGTSTTTTASRRRGAPTSLGVPEPWWPEEDEVDEEVRADLDRWERDGDVSFVGRDGPRRFPATRRQALAALDHFVEHRLPHFGAHEDAILEGDPWMAHSLVSAPLNLGLLDPLEVVRRAEEAWLAGAAPIASVEGFVPAGARLARLRLAPLLALRRALPPPQRAARDRAGAEVVRRARRRGDRRPLPLAHPGPGGDARLGAPHPAADGARVVRDAAGLVAGAGDRLVPPLRSSTATTG